MIFKDSKIRLEHQLAFITGGASGIGRALGEELARYGCEVVLADRQIELAEEVAENIRKSGGKASAVFLNVTDLTQWKTISKELLERTQGIDFLFNNAGIGVAAEISQYDPEDWDDVIDVNLRGVAYGVHTFYPVMIRQGRGHIINTSSMAGLMGGHGSYGTTKHAVVGLSKGLRIEAARKGVRVSVLCPGVIRTPILTLGRYGHNKSEISPEIMQELFERMHPMDPDKFARRTLRRIMRNEAIIVEPSWWKAFWYFERISPDLSLYIHSKMHQRFANKIEALSSAEDKRH